MQSRKRMSEIDQQLLVKFIAEGSEPAFGELVERNIDHVHSVAFHTTCNAEMARDVVQQVFTKLAAAPTSVPRRIPIQTWLHTKTRSLAIDMVRSEQSRSNREVKYAESTNMNTSECDQWRTLAPVLDEVIGQLKPTEQQIIILRFYRDLSHVEIGDTIGVTANAARVRLQRALEKMRLLLGRKGVTTTAAMLASTLPGHAVTPATSGMAAAITQIALTKSASTVVAGNVTTLSLLTMTKLQFTAIAAGIGLLSLCVWQSNRIATLKKSNTRLSRQAIPRKLAESSLNPPAKDLSASKTQGDVNEDSVSTTLKDSLHEMLFLLKTIGRKPSDHPMPPGPGMKRRTESNDYRAALRSIATALIDEFESADKAWDSVAQEPQSPERDKLLAEILKQNTPKLGNDGAEWQTGIGDRLAKLKEIGFGLQHAQQVMALADALDHGHSEGIEAFAKSRSNPEEIAQLEAKIDSPDTPDADREGMKIWLELARARSIDVDTWYDQLNTLGDMVSRAPADMPEYDESRRALARMASHEDAEVAIHWIDAINNEEIRRNAAVEFIDNERRRAAREEAVAKGKNQYSYPILKVPDNLSGTGSEMIEYLRSHGEIEATSHSNIVPGQVMPLD